MSVDERLQVARQAYAQAVASARRDSSPARWRRLLAAAKNLRLAIRDREHAVRARTAVPPQRVGAWTESVGPARADAPTVAALGRVHRPPRPPSTTWTELVREIERARALVAWSKRLVAESRALCASARDLGSGRVAPAGPAPTGAPA